MTACTIVDPYTGPAPCPSVHTGVPPIENPDGQLADTGGTFTAVQGGAVLLLAGLFAVAISRRRWPA